MTGLFDPEGITDAHGVTWSPEGSPDVAAFLAANHYLGPLVSADLTVSGYAGGELVAVMMWRHPTARNLPVTRWLELSRWCLTPLAGRDAGSRMHKAAVRLIRQHRPHVTTLVSYSDPDQGHTGSLYRACNWAWCPTWQRLRTPPSGNGAWSPGQRQAVKDRWIFPVRPDPQRAADLAVKDDSAVRYWQANAKDYERRWSQRSLTPELAA